MGNFKVEVQAVGGHGCQRELGDQARVEGCGKENCPDCITRRYVAQLKANGCTVDVATLQHWPGTPGEVKDDLVSQTRYGKFG